MVINEYCQKSNDGSAHCPHWYELWPCCWCEDDTEDLECDCDMHERNRAILKGKNMKTIFLHDSDSNRTLLNKLVVNSAVSWTSMVDGRPIQFIVGWYGNDEDFKKAMAAYLDGKHNEHTG